MHEYSERKAVLTVLAVTAALMAALLLSAPLARSQGFTDYGQSAADQYGAVPTPTATPPAEPTPNQGGTAGEDQSSDDDSGSGDDDGGGGGGDDDSCSVPGASASSHTTPDGCPDGPGGGAGDVGGDQAGPGGGTGAERGSGLPLRDATGNLPFTGLDLGLLVLLGVTLVAVGAALRLAARTRTARRAA